MNTAATTEELDLAAELGRISAEKSMPELFGVLLKLIPEDTFVGEPRTVALIAAFRDTEQDVRDCRAGELLGYQEAALRKRDIT